MNVSAFVVIRERKSLKAAFTLESLYLRTFARPSLSVSWFVGPGDVLLALWGIPQVLEFAGVVLDETCSAYFRAGSVDCLLFVFSVFFHFFSR